MSFNINWNSLDKDSLTNWTKELLTDALNFGKRPNVLASNIAVKDLDFGDSAPLFEILEIGDVAQDRFRGIFKVHYSGNAHLTLHTQVRANPLNTYSAHTADQGTSFTTPSFLLASESFALPLDLRLSDIKLSGIVVIVFSREKGLTLVFRNDPLETITVSSTFDNVKILAAFLQTQIENQIRDVFRETLPGVLYRLSQKYTVDSNLQDLHSHLIAKQEEGERIMLDDINPESPHFLSEKNMRKLATLASSRQTFALYVPYMPDVYQRSNLEKFNRHTPTLSNALNVDSSSDFNGIPREMLVSDTSTESGLASSWRLERALHDISKIQAKAYYKSYSSVKPKRRVVRVGGSKREAAGEESGTSTRADGEGQANAVAPTLASAPVPLLVPASTSPHGESTRSVPAVLHPTPVKPNHKNHPQIAVSSPLRHKQKSYPLDSPSHSSATLFSNLGLGYANNYFLHSKKLELDDITPKPTPPPTEYTHPSTAQIKSNLSRLNSTFKLDHSALRPSFRKAKGLGEALSTPKGRGPESRSGFPAVDQPPPYVF